MVQAVLAVLLFPGLVAAAPLDQRFDSGWQFLRGDDTASLRCDASTFEQDQPGLFCLGLIKISAHMESQKNPGWCEQRCCEMGDSCETWSFCPSNKPCSSVDSPEPGVPMAGCWVGATTHANPPIACSATKDGWVTRSRKAVGCTRKFCAPDYDDKNWRGVDLPHDWSVEDLPGEQTNSEVSRFSHQAHCDKTRCYASIFSKRRGPCGACSGHPLWSLGLLKGRRSNPGLG
jgi:hypothetical protein